MNYRHIIQRVLGIGGAMLLLGALAGCTNANSKRVQGYVEGEYVYVAAPPAGQLVTLYVRRGAWVQAGDQLFALESRPERATRDEAARRLAQARATLEDVKKGKRPTELESLEAQLRQAKSALSLSQATFEREDKLFRSGAGVPQDFDRARSQRDQDRQRVSQLEADLATARLGARADQIKAAEENVSALGAILAKAKWELDQKQQAAPESGLVFDTLFQKGEWVGAGRPVVALLPPDNVKVRAFVPEARIGSVRLGQSVRVTVDGVDQPYVGKVSFISPRAEYTPPVIYSRETRAKLVFLIEARFDSETATQLHPGQPVDVEFID